MKSAGELKYIQEKISELKIKTESNGKNPQVKFLKKYREFVKPAMTNIFKIKINL